MIEPRPLSFNAYLQRRGFDTGSVVAILRRMFLEAWTEPGLHRFWRVWNPAYGYVLWRLYLACGGRKRPLFATSVAFTPSGFFAHDLLTFAMSGTFTLGFTLTFLFYGLMTIASRVFQDTLQQQRWPRPLNAIANFTALAVGAVAGPALYHLWLR